jgi:hypothetical protein
MENLNLELLIVCMIPVLLIGVLAILSMPRARRAGKPKSHLKWDDVWQPGCAQQPTQVKLEKEQILHHYDYTGGTKILDYSVRINSDDTDVSGNI